MSEALVHRPLITGKNGQVGRELVARATELGLQVMAFDSTELDIRNRAAVLAAVAKHKPTVVINAAAYTAVDKAEEEKELAYAVNRDGVENLALACKDQDIPLIHISTDYVFDGEKSTPYLVSDTPNPTSVYGGSKLAGEEVLRATWEKHIILRVSWVFGVHGNNFVKTMIRVAKERDELSVVSDQFGAPTSAYDISNVILNSVNKGEPDEFGLFHLESNPGVTWSDFATEIFSQALDMKILETLPGVISILSEHYPTPVKRPMNSKLSSESDSPFPSVEWKPALKEMLLSLKSQ